jgi:hypothetical protein
LHSSIGRTDPIDIRKWRSSPGNYRLRVGQRDLVPLYLEALIAQGYFTPLSSASGDHGVTYVNSPGRSLPAISPYQPRRLPKVEAYGFDFEALTLFPSLKILSVYRPKKTGFTGDPIDEVSNLSLPIGIGYLG